MAVENLRSRINAALGLTAQGFKDRCEIPAGASAGTIPGEAAPAWWSATVPDAGDALT